MNNVLSVLNHVLPIFLAMAWVNYSVYFVRRDPFAHRTATPFLVIIAVLQSFYVILLGVSYRHHLMANIFEVFTVIALALTLVYLIVETAHRNKSMGVFVLPLIFLFQLISSVWIRPGRSINPVLKDPLFGLHTGSIALAYSAFLLSAVYGVMYRVFYRALRAKRFGLIFERLPSLDVLARMTMGATTTGFVFLSFAVIFGALWAARVAPEFRTDPKFLLTLVVWAVYGFAVVCHHLLHWAGRRVVSISLTGFLLLIVSFLSLRLLLVTFHQFGG
ncbi:MAG: cytochrome c biogenesis protein CcsA [Candidatus Eisenbacteria bacterium]